VFNAVIQCGDARQNDRTHAARNDKAQGDNGLGQSEPDSHQNSPRHFRHNEFERMMSFAGHLEGCRARTPNQKWMRFGACCETVQSNGECDVSSGTASSGVAQSGQVSLSVSAIE
jgi:hypothetical protein